MSRRAAARRYAMSGFLWRSSGSSGLNGMARESLSGTAATGRPSSWRTVIFCKPARTEKTDVTLQALCDRLSAERGVKADTSMMSRFFCKIGVTFKKRPVGREQDRPGTSVATANDGETIRAASIPGDQPPIDETWTKTNMTRLRGWAPKGRAPLVDKVPQGKWKTATFLAVFAMTASMRPAVRRPDQRRTLPRLCRAVPRPDPQAGRRCDPRQSRLPQGEGGAEGHPSLAARLFNFFCPSTPPTSTRSSRSSPSSATSAAKGRSAKLPGDLRRKR